MAVVRKCSCGQEYPKSFSIGERFNISGGFSSEYLLCITADSNHTKVQLINVDTGCLFNGCITVEDYNDITPEEFDNFFGVFDNYRIVCPKCKTQYNEVKITYSIGQRFKLLDHEYILASTQSSTVTLINLENGCRFLDGVKVGDLYHITEEEMEEISGGYKFQLME